MYKIGFIGLGRIGYQLAGNISNKFNTYVWNRSKEKSINHTKDFNTKFNRRNFLNFKL